MLSRVTENMKFSAATSNLTQIESKYNDLIEQISSQKQINKPSDDPIGMSRILDLRKTKSSIEQYQRNIDNSKGWLTETESKLTSVNDLLVQARELATAQASGTATAETRQIAASSLEQILDEILSLSNSQYNGRYLFAGSSTDAAPFSAEAGATRTEIHAAGGNAFDGTVDDSGSTFTGTANKTYVVKIVGGGNFTDATYQVSTDGGATFDPTVYEDLDSGSIAVTDGSDVIRFNFTAGTRDFSAGDVFSINAYPSGYYTGNSEDLSVNIGYNTSFAYNISGDKIFTDQGGGSVDVFGVLGSLKSAMESNDTDGIQSQIDNLKSAMDTVNLRIAECGTKTNRLEMSKSNLTSMSDQITEQTSNIEDADITKLITDYSMKQVALQAAYRIAASVGQNTIMNFLK